MNLTLTGSEFHRVGAATGRALVLMFVLTLGTKSRLELDDRSCLGCLAGVGSECRYVSYCISGKRWRSPSLINRERD